MRRVDLTVLWLAALIAGIVPLLVTIEPALRHGGAGSRHDPWMAWQLTPEITLARLLVAYIYIAGQRHPDDLDDRQGALRCAISSSS